MVVLLNDYLYLYQKKVLPHLAALFADKSLLKLLCGGKPYLASIGIRDVNALLDIQEKHQGVWEEEGRPLEDMIRRDYLGHSRFKDAFISIREKGAAYENLWSDRPLFPGWELVQAINCYLLADLSLRMDILEKQSSQIYTMNERAVEEMVNGFDTEFDDVFTERPVLLSAQSPTLCVCSKSTTRSASS